MFSGHDFKSLYCNQETKLENVNHDPQLSPDCSVTLSTFVPSSWLYTRLVPVEI